jgi:hypothetical protein
MAVGTSDDGVETFMEMDEETELVEATDELKNVGLIGVALEILGLVVSGLVAMLDCGVGVVIGEVLVVGMFIVGAVVRST